jgi:hypothetical protein
MCYHSGFAGGVLSPILVRPVREQLEHDRVIRLLQAKLKRKHDVAANAGDQQGASVRVGPGQMFPDLVLSSLDKAHRLEGIIEVETGESVNHLEAMAQWAHFGRIRAPFHLYVPAAAVDIARRLCTENQVGISELWSYHSIGDQTRFTLVQRVNSQDLRPVPAAKPAAPKPSGAKPSGAKPSAAKPSAAKGAPPKSAAKAPAARKPAAKPAPAAKAKAKPAAKKKPTRK